MTRWTLTAKADVCRRVLIGEMGPEEACRAYEMSAEELNGWLARYRAHGAGGLKATRRVR